MNRIKQVLIALTMSFISIASYAQEPQASKLDLSIGTQAFYYQYEEPDLMENEGYMYGVSYAADYKLSPDLNLVFDGFYATGTVDYTSVSTGSYDDSENTMTDNRILLGYAPMTQSEIKSSIYFGLGYRYLFVAGENQITTTGYWGYDRISRYLYSPIGLNFKSDVGSWGINANIEYDHLWVGRQSSYLGYLSGYTDVDNYQYSGYGYRTSISFLREITPKNDLVIEPFLRYWNIDDSDEVYMSSQGISLIEPENNTYELGVNFSMSFNM